MTIKGPDSLEPSTHFAGFTKVEAKKPEEKERVNRLVPQHIQEYVEHRKVSYPSHALEWRRCLSVSMRRAYIGSGAWPTRLTRLCTANVQNTLSGAAMDRDDAVVKKKGTKKTGRRVGPNGFFPDELPDQVLKREHLDNSKKVHYSSSCPHRGSRINLVHSSRP